MSEIEKPFDKELNYDTATAEKIEQTNWDLAEYMMDTGELVASEQIMYLIENQKTEEEKKPVLNPINDKLLAVNKGILAVLKKIREEAFDEQDTSIKQVGTPVSQMQSDSDNVLSMSDGSVAKPGSTGVLDMLGDALGALAAGKMAKDLLRRTPTKPVTPAKAPANNPQRSTQPRNSTPPNQQRQQPPKQTPRASTPPNQAKPQPAKPSTPAKPATPAPRPTTPSSAPSSAPKTSTPNPPAGSSNSRFRVPKGVKFGGGILAATMAAATIYTVANDESLSEEEKNVEYTKAAGVGLGAWGGAAAGASIGSAVPIVGTLIGGIVGGALGAYYGEEAGAVLGGSLFDSQTLWDKYDDELGIVDHSRFGNSEVVKWFPIENGALTASEIQDIIDLDDWSEEDKERLIKAKESQERAQLTMATRLASMTPEQRQIAELKDKHDSELTRSERETLRDNEIKDLEESITLGEKAVQDLAVRYANAKTDQEREAIQQIMIQQGNAVELQKDQLSRLTATDAAPLTVNNKVQVGSDPAQQQDYQPPETEVEVTPSQPNTTPREKQINQTSKNLTQTTRAAEAAAMQPIYAAINNTSINRTITTDKPSNEKLLNIFTYG